MNNTQNKLQFRALLNTALPISSIIATASVASGLLVSSATHTRAETRLSTVVTPIQMASTQRRYNFNRAPVATQRYFYKKKKKYRKKVKYRSYRQRLKDIQTWQVDENNKDPIQLVVSRSEQKISVYKGSELVTTSRVSSGKRGHETPTGVFSILGKKVFHRSNIYSAAPMPYMQRLTWSGVALHASNSVPNHPASHGCVRLPNSFAPKLFKFTERGAHVIIADEKPRIVDFSGLDILKPLSAEEREKELALLKEKLVAEKLAELKAEREKEQAKKAKLKAQKQQEAKTESEVAQTDAPELPEVEVNLSESPLRILITRRLGRERVMDVQDMLRELGFDPGESDGYMGKDTGKAILAFQKEKGFKETGAFSDELETQLYQIARKSVAPTGFIYVRQDFRDVLSAPIIIKDPHLPLGTHLITAQHFDAGETLVRWRGMTLKDEVPEFLAREEEGGDKSSTRVIPAHNIKLAMMGEKAMVVASNTQSAPAENTQSSESAAKQEAEQQEAELDAVSRQKIEVVLGRISIPQDVVKKLSFLLTPGSSIAISDKGLSKETTPHGTDFILLTR